MSASLPHYCAVPECLPARLTGPFPFPLPAAYALGFLDCDNISARCMLTIFQFFATKTDASVLRMLSGSPEERLLKPIAAYIEAKGGRIHTRMGCKCVEAGLRCHVLLSLR